jgi:lipopolysaccharide heptosyltransferase I
MRILIVKLSSIGDVVHALPATSFLRRAMPVARISWVVERRAGAILRGCPAIDELIEIDTRAWRSGWSKAATFGEIRRLTRDLREGPAFDIAIDFQGLIKSGLVAFASRARRRIGFEPAELRESASRVFLTEHVNTSCFTHVIEKNLALARAAAGSAVGILPGGVNDPFSYEFPIAVSPEDERYIDAATGSARGRLAILNPGGGWPTKLWPASSYGEIADWLAQEYNLLSLVTYGPGEEDLAGEVAASSQSGSARIFASTLKQFVALARRAALFVGGDSGPLHLAAASGTPIVGLYGPTSPERNGPFDPRDLAIGRDLWCRAGCHRRSCWHWECMDIGTSAIKQAISRRLAFADSRSHKIEILTGSAERES